MSDEWEVLREVWLITERRDGAVFRTKDTGERKWVPMGVHGSGDELYCPITDENLPMSQRMRRKA